MLDDLSTGVDQAAGDIAKLKSTSGLAGLKEPAALKTANNEAKAYGLGTCSNSSS